MQLTNLKQRPSIQEDSKLNSRYLQFKKLVGALKHKDLSNKMVAVINKNIEELNLIPDIALKKAIKKKQCAIIKLLEKEHKIVPKNHYRTVWLALGMSIFGIPLGVIFGLMIDNMAFLGTGLPVGMVIGMAVGAQMDKKAFEEGRQLDIELKN